VQDLGLQDVVKKVGFIPHDEAIDLLSRADVILDIGIEGPWSESLIPAKLMEAIGLGRPILSISVPGEASRIVESLDVGWWASQDDARAIVDALMSAMNAQPSAVFNPPMVFSRRFQAEQLAELMDEIRASPDI
jgi:glycosyltransferase involved in cell wall biosynthesis